jgi:protein deglycase
MPTVLFFLAEGFEEIEAITPLDLLRRAGAEVTTAALADGIHVTGRNGVTIHADTVLSSVGDKVFDCLVIPGGPGVARLRSDSRVASLVRRHHEAGVPLAAICAAPLVLHDLGLLSGRAYTGHSSTAPELTALRSDERVVWDGLLLTSRGAGTAQDFGLALVERLFGPEQAGKIARSIEA